MVFESIVVDLLNRILGSYFENLDTSQLKLGIWGGDAVLRDLVLKTSAMDDLGLPFKVVIGKLGLLTMRIPWQSLYTAPVELDLKNLYLLVVPSYAVAYNEEQEESALQARKQAEIARIDELRKHEQMKKAGTADAPPPDTFAEKLITQIIKNVQIRIESIHIRYEDSVTIPEHPFAFGAILKNLNVQTTDENWKLAIITETVNVIHKLAKLEGLSVYWNSSTNMISRMTDKPKMLQGLQEFVEKDTLLTHVLGPISSEGRVKLTPSPEKLKFSQSKFVVDVDMKELAIGLTNRQFQDAMSLAEALDFMSRASHYRKYRPPFTAHKGHYKEWWKFAYRCIVEEDVRRRQLNWDWGHIKQHRELVKVYADVYYQKLTNTNKKLKPELDAKILQCEKALDVFNITLVRKQVEVRVDRSVKKEPEKKAGWFSGWFGGGSGAATSEPTTSATADIAKKFEEALTPEEKAKLYDAIDYSEGAAPVDYPQTYLAYVLHFHLHRLRCIVLDVSGKRAGSEKILDLQIANVEHSISTRPYKNGVKLDLKLGSIEAIGVQRSEKVPPSLISSKSTGIGGQLVEASFETNPLTSSASQKITLSLAPVEIVYHSKTIIELVRCFTLPAAMQLNKLQAATMATINEWREQSAAGLQHLIETRGEIEINIQFLAPYFLIPQGGILSKNGSVLVFDLGEISVKSKPRARDRIDKGEHSKKTKDEIRQEIIDKSYDSFLVKLKDFQVLLALPGDNFRAAIQKNAAAKTSVPTTVATKPPSSGMELIKSHEFVVQLDQCLVQDDPQLPKFKISAHLPLLDLVISEHRFLELVKLLVTLPFPKSAPPVESSVTGLSHDTMLAESVAVSRIAYAEMQKTQEKDVVQFTEVVLLFRIASIRVLISRGLKGSVPMALAEFELRNLETKLTQRTFSMGIDVVMGGVTLIASSHAAPGFPKGQLYLLRTPMNQQHLLKIVVFSISSDCPPKFATKVKQSINCDVSTLDLILHQEALYTLMNFVSQITESFQNALQASDSVSSIVSVQPSVYVLKKEDKKQVSKFQATQNAIAKKHQDSKDILLGFSAHLNRLTVQLSTETKNILRLVLGQLDVSYEQRPKKAIMSMELTEFELLNLDPAGFYTKIITQQLDKVIYVQVKMYEGGTEGPGYSDVSRYDMKLKVETGSPRIVYLNPFLDEVMLFVDKFQAAKESVMAASAAAAELAREGAQQAYSTGTRVLIDIEFKAPHIIIPRNAQSSTGFIAYLGHLSVKNSFKEMVASPSGDKVILDDIQTVLTEMKMSRIIMDKDNQKVTVECSILDPVTLRLNIQRNLGVGAYPEIPAIQIKGEMASTSIRCSSEDYGVLMASLTENISSKSPSALEANKETVPAVGPTVKVEGKTTALVSRRASKIRAEPEPKPTTEVVAVVPAKKDDKVHCNFKLELVMEQTSLVLYEGSSNLEGKQGVVERNAKTGFAKFTIANIDVGVLMYTNGNLTCTTGIGSISLTDVRPGERQITNLIHKRGTTVVQGSETVLAESLISVNYRSEPGTKQGNTVIIEITGMTFVLCLEYLYRLIGFFTAQPNGPVVEQERMKIEEFNPAGEPGPVREITPPKPKMDGSGDGKIEAEPFRVFLTMGETDLILVETVERLDTNGLLLNCELSVRQTTEGGKTNLMCAMNKIRLSTCKYDPDNRGNSLAEVISPMSITLVMNTTVEGTQIDINISDIYVRLTAGTLELLVKIVSTSLQAGSNENAAGDVTDWTNVWNLKTNKESNFWFLDPDGNVELGVDALMSPEDTARLFDQLDEIVKKERLVLESGCIVLTFETGSGTNTTPVLLIESDIDMQIFDWSQKLQMTGRMKLEAAYYNAIYGMWEFLIEPVETRHHGKVSHRPWELFFEYNTVECTSTNLRSRQSQGPGSPSKQGGDEEGEEDSDKVPSYMSISLQSNDILELTLTKTALDVVNMLVADFNEAVKSLVSQREVMTSPYVVTNDLGVDIKLDFRSSPFTLVRKGQLYEEALLKPGTSLNLTLADNFDMTTRHTSILKEQEGREERLLRITVEDFGFSADIPVNRAERRYYPLKRTNHGESQALLCDTSVNGTSKVVTIRSVVEVLNHLKIDVDVYYMSDDGNSLLLAGTAKAGKPFNVPVTCVYTKSSELYFAPKGYNASSLATVWTVLLKDKEGFRTQLLCRQKAGQEKIGSECHVVVIGEMKETLFEGTNRTSAHSRCVFVHLKAPLIINNMLPVDLDFGMNETLASVRSAEKGHSIQVTDMAVDKNKEFSIVLKITSYENQSWIALIDITRSTSELSPWLFTSTHKKENTLYLGIHKDTSDESLTLHVYSPFWMINRTNLTLSYHAEDHKDTTALVHVPDSNPKMFSFRGKSFFTKKKAVVRVEGESDWSTKFPVDVAGSRGSVTCKSPMMEYEIGIEIVLSGWGLSKGVIFTPRYYLINQCSYVIEVTEAEKEGSKVKVSPSSCIPFWPKSRTAQLVLRIDQTNEFSKKFSYEKSDEILLQLGNKYGGVHVDVHITEASHLLTFTEFTEGHAAVLVVNQTTDSTIEIWDKGSDIGRRKIGPEQNQLLTWQDPMGEKSICWAPVGMSNHFVDRLNGDGFGNYKVANDHGDERQYHWLSFLDGLQRVLLFTPDKHLVSTLQASRDIEIPTAEYSLVFHGLGLSLVNAAKNQEILYMRIASSDVIWESVKPGKRQRFKPIPIKKSALIEYAYENYQKEKIVNPNVKSRVTLDAGLEVDFVDMKMYKPYDRTIQRVFQTGVWLHYKTYPHTMLMHAKLNRLQIDNQLPDCIFRTVLSPVPPPKSVSSDEEKHGKKPFAEISIMERIIEHSSVVQYKYFKVLVQEFHVKMDIHFVNALIGMFSEDTEKQLERMVEYFDKDYDEATLDYQKYLNRHIVLQGQKNFYDFLHFSPLKIHLSFSMGGATQLSNSFLNLLIASLGVSVTEVQDVVFKLACMEIQHMFLTREQIYSEAYQHYSSQALRQLYVLVLGLDVIGNPYGLLVGLTQGVGAFFYEPFQGAIQGPGEFMEGLALGVKSLFGHTIGGMSGAMSKITGTFGKGVAALTLDDEYQKKRRENISKRQTAGEGFVESGKDLVMGFFEGVTGVVSQPIKGAKKEGVGGFFKGLGKGAIGLVTRPAAGVIDFTSGSFDAVKKATGVSDETHRMRPPRYIPPNNGLQPYVLHEAEGMALFTELEKGKYVPTDTYIAHALVNPHGIYVILITNRRVLYLKKIDIFGGWAIQWTALWEELEGPPDVLKNGLAFRIKPDMTKPKLLRCQTKASQVVIPLYSPDVCVTRNVSYFTQWLLDKIEDAMRKEMGVTVGEEAINAEGSGSGSRLEVALAGSSKPGPGSGPRPQK